MALVDWKQAIERWRALPEAEKHRIRWERIPRKVAASMAFAGEPVSLSMLEAWHARVPMPPIPSKKATTTGDGTGGAT